MIDGADAAPREGARLLRDASFLGLCLGQSVSAVGDRCSSIAVAVWILAREDGPAALGVVFAARTLATSLLLLVGGALSDRVAARRQVIATQLVLCATMALLAAMPPDAPLLAILGAFAFAGAVDAFLEPAGRVVLVDLAGAARLASANSIAAMSLRLAGLAGPALGGVLVAAVGVRATLLVDAGTFLVAAGAVASTRVVPRPRTPGGTAGAARIVAEAFGGLGMAARTGWLRAVLLSDLAQTLLAVAPWFVLLPIALVPRGPAAYALALSAFAAGGLLGTLVPLRWAPRAIGRAALLSQALFAAPLAALAFDLPLPLIVAAAAVGGFGADLGAVLFAAGLQRGVPRAMLGRVSAVSALGSIALVPLGLAAAGALAAPIGARPMLLAGAIVVLVVTAAALRAPGVARMADPAAGGPPAGSPRP